MTEIPQTYPTGEIHLELLYGANAVKVSDETGAIDDTIALSGLSQMEAVEKFSGHYCEMGPGVHEAGGKMTGRIQNAQAMAALFRSEVVTMGTFQDNEQKFLPTIVARYGNLAISGHRATPEEAKEVLEIRKQQKALKEQARRLELVEADKEKTQLASYDHVKIIIDGKKYFMDLDQPATYAAVRFMNEFMKTKPNTYIDWAGFRHGMWQNMSLAEREQLTDEKQAYNPGCPTNIEKMIWPMRSDLLMPLGVIQRQGGAYRNEAVIELELSESPVSDEFAQEATRIASPGAPRSIFGAPEAEEREIWTQKKSGHVLIHFWSFTQKMVLGTRKP